MSESNDFFSQNAGKKVGDLRASALRLDEMENGRYAIQVVSVAPVFLEKLQGYSLRWSGKVHGGPLNGQSIAFGQLMNNDRSLGQVMAGLNRLGLKAEEVTELVRNAGEVLPGQVVAFDKTEYTTKAGRTYHDMVTVELLESEGLPF
jgi:hypothetical protein